MPDYKGYECAVRWKGTHWEIAVYEQKPDTSAIFEGTLKATEPTDAASALGHSITKQVVDALTDPGGDKPFVLGSSALDGPHKLG